MQAALGFCDLALEFFQPHLMRRLRFRARDVALILSLRQWFTVRCEMSNNIQDYSMSSSLLRLF